MQKIEADIAKVEKEIQDAAAKAEAGKNKEDVCCWRQKELALRQKEHDLRQEKFALLTSSSSSQGMLSISCVLFLLRVCVSCVHS